MLIEHFCAKCKKPLSEDEHPCSNCGCNDRYSKGYLEDSVLPPEDSITRQKQKRPGIRDYVYEVKNIRKISGKTKRSTKDKIIIDKTNPEYTYKRHEIEEWIDGKWVKVWDKESKAKHRKKKI